MQGDARQPELIRLRLIEATVQQIGILVNSLLVVGIGSAAANDRQVVFLFYNRRRLFSFACFSGNCPLK